MPTANIPNDPVAIQKLFTSRDNYANAESFVGEVQRLWYNPITNCIYVSDGNTPGGIPINFCGSANLSANLEILDEGVTITTSTASIDFVGAGVTATAAFGGAVTVSVPVQSYIANGTSWANIADANGNLTININNNQWIFDTTGNLAAPGNISAVGNIQGDWLIASGGNTIIDTGISTTGNVTGGNIVTVGNIQGGNISVSGNATAGNISTTGNVTGNYGIFSGGNTVINSTISTTGNIIAGNVSVIGNVVAGNIIGNTSLNFGYYGAFHSDSNTTLTNAINTNSTDPILVGSTAGFRTSGYIVIDTEVIQYTGISGNTFTGITRGVAGSQKAGHSGGAGVGAAQVTPAGVAATVLMDITDFSNGVTLNSTTGQVTVVHAGLYNCQFSVQGANFGNDYDDFAVWFVLNGNNIPYTASYSTLSLTHAGEPGATILTVNLFYQFADNDVLTLQWTSIQGTTAIASYPPSTTVIPASPGIIFTVNQIA